MSGEPAKKKPARSSWQAWINAWISYFILALHSFSSFGSTILAHPDLV